MAGGLVTDAGAVVHELVRPSAVGGRGDPGLAVALGLARELLAEAARRGLAVAGLGAGLPEYVDSAGRLTSREVVDWTVQPADLFAALLTGPRCVIDSDARCAALAESRLGAARGLDDFVYVSLGTGLSSAVVWRGVPLTGRRGEAIALGELEVSARVDADWDGNLEAYCSGAGLARRYARRTGKTVPGAEEVARRAQAGDGAAQAILATAGGALGHALASVVALLDPHAIVLGGGLGTAGGLLRDELLAGYAACTARRPGAPLVLTAQLGRRAGIVGAALRAQAGTPSPSPRAVR